MALQTNDDKMAELDEICKISYFSKILAIKCNLKNGLVWKNLNCYDNAIRKKNFVYEF